MRPCKTALPTARTRADGQPAPKRGTAVSHRLTLPHPVIKIEKTDTWKMSALSEGAANSGDDRRSPPGLGRRRSRPAGRCRRCGATKSRGVAQAIPEQGIDALEGLAVLALPVFVIVPSG